MRCIAFPASLRTGSSPDISVLGFGCAAVMGRVGRKDSLYALALAWDAGINFFDTARSYGYGDSERLLGCFLKGRRDSATKNGPSRSNIAAHLPVRVRHTGREQEQAATLHRSR